jgi:hypothetical protein
MLAVLMQLKRSSPKGAPFGVVDGVQLITTDAVASTTGGSFRFTRSSTILPTRPSVYASLAGNSKSAKLITTFFMAMGTNEMPDHALQRTRHRPVVIVTRVDRVMPTIT